jgi:hypothetical protein
MELVAIRNPLDRGHFVTVNLGCKYQAGVDRLTIEQYRA